MKKLLTSAVLASLAIQYASAATQDQIDAANQQAQEIFTRTEQDIEQQRERISPQELPSGVDLTDQLPDAPALPIAAGECIELEALEMPGATLLDEWELEVLEVPFLGQCLSTELVTGVLTAATDFYISRGFVTSRAYLPNQNLRDGTLTIQIAEGQVAEVKINGTITTSNTYPKVDGEALSIRDLEQAVDQLNAVPGRSVTMSIEPGEKPDESIVAFNNTSAARATGQISIDNSGSQSTGENIVSLSVKAGNIFNQNEVWTLAARSSKQSDAEDTLGYDVDVKFPAGYSTYGVGVKHSQYETLLNFPATNTVLNSQGNTETVFVSASRVLYRDQDSKHSATVKLERVDTESFIGGERIGVSSRGLTGLAVSGNSALTFGNKVLILAPEMMMGLTEVDNLPSGANTPVENPQAEYLRFKMTVDYSQPITGFYAPLTFKSKFSAQYAEEPLYGSQKFSVGGAGSVRGFKGTSISGERGYFVQNSLITSKPISLGSTTINTSTTLGYDWGSVGSPVDGAYRGSMSGWTLGTLFSLTPFSIGIDMFKPLTLDGRDKGHTQTTARASVSF